MDTTQWPQRNGGMEGGGAIRRGRGEKDGEVKCPRCNSSNTKFCYYNNYSLSQPRFFCKTCRRYWTAGGSLRNVPVGGGSRKNKRPSSSSSSSSSKIDHLPATTQNPSKIQYQAQDLNLAYPPTSSDHVHDQDHHLMSKFVIEMPQYDQNPNNNSATQGIGDSSSFMSMAGSSANGFNPLQGAMSLSLHGYGHDNGAAKLVFPFEDPNSRGHGSSTGYWTGMLGGGDGGSSW